MSGQREPRVASQERTQVLWQVGDSLVDHCRNSGSFLFVWVKSDATEGF